ncbi:MAG: aldo/keto reductase, partial [Chloroflexi bacterium]|nr:aldo/keto reductase [Chloroflexota bacterium]
MEPTAIGRDPGERVTLGSTAVAVTRLGLGTGPLGWPVEAATEQTAAAVVDASWSAGVRYFDTAPLYGLGQVEQWLGNALRERPRGDFSLLTKVGRLLRATPSDAGGRATRPSGDSETGCIRDYSADGTLRSLEESLRRLGLERVDIVLIHDPEEHVAEALDGAYVALDRLRAQGVVGAIGAGMNHTEPLTRLVRNADLDCVLLAGRYSLLDQSALSELLPAAAARGTSLIVGGVYNSGILADPQPGALFHYRPAPADVLARVQRMREICRHHGVPLAAAAIQ